MNDTMKAISQDELGGPEVLKLVTLPTPAPRRSARFSFACTQPALTRSTPLTGKRVR